MRNFDHEGFRSPFAREAVRAVEDAGIPFPSPDLTGRFLGVAVAEFVKEMLRDDAKVEASPQLKELASKVEKLQGDNDCLVQLVQQNQMLISWLLANSTPSTRESMERNYRSMDRHRNLPGDPRL